MRIDIVGVAGSGKSTLALNLSKKLRIPHIQIDTFWFEAGGRQGPHDTPNIEEVRTHIRKRVEDFVSTESWISDGTYMRAQDLIASSADSIIFLDIPLLTRLIGHTRRAFFEPKRHEHLTVWDEIKFYKEIFTRTYTTRPKILRFLENYKDKTIVLKSHKEINNYLQQIGNV